MSLLFTKDPQAVLDYGIDWSDWLAGDTIATSVWIVPSDLVNEDEANTAATTTVWLSGGTHGRDYAVTNRIITAGGRTEDRSLIIKVRSR